MNVYSLIPKVIADRGCKNVQDRTATNTSDHTGSASSTSTIKRKKIKIKRNGSHLRVIPSPKLINIHKNQAKDTIQGKAKSNHYPVQSIESFLDQISSTSSNNNKKRSYTHQKNPSLDNIVPLMFKNGEIQYVRSILHHYNTYFPHVVKWNDSGELYSPITNVNILRVVKYYISNDLNSTISKDKAIKDKIAIMESVAPISNDYLRHKTVQKVSKKPPTRPRPSTQDRNSSWETYV